MDILHKNEITFLSLKNAVYMNNVWMVGFDKNFQFSGQKFFGEISRRFSRVNHFAGQLYRCGIGCGSEFTQIHLQVIVVRIILFFFLVFICYIKILLHMILRQFLKTICSHACSALILRI